MKKIISVLILFCWGAGSLPCWAIDDFSKKMSSRQYAGLVLERRNRSAHTGGMIDAIVFLPSQTSMPENNRYHFIRRLDEDYVVILYCSKGRELAKITQNKVPDYRKMIKDNMLEPYVISDKNGTEVMTVYCALRPCSIIWTEKKKGEILLRLYNTFKEDDARDSGFNRFWEGK